VCSPLSGLTLLTFIPVSFLRRIALKEGSDSNPLRALLYFAAGMVIIVTWSLC
jgi:hypothetical protein